MSKKLGYIAFLLALGPLTVWGAAPVADDALIRITADYQYVIGSADYTDADGDPEAGSLYAWQLNSAPLSNGTAPQLFYLSCDGDALAGDGQAPLESGSEQFGTGKWGSAFTLDDGGSLAYARANNLDWDAGTLGMWIALRADSDDPIYSQKTHYLFHYMAANDDDMIVAQSRTSGIIYFGGSVGGEWQSAYGGRASMQGWVAGEWHHVACTWSTANNRMRFYLDGALIADTNEDHYWAPPSTGDRFYLGGNVWNSVAHYWIDEVQILSYEADGDEIRARAARLSEPLHGEVWLATNTLNPGDILLFQYTPSDGTGTGAVQTSDPYIYLGVPLGDPDPPSTLLPANSSSFNLTLSSTAPLSCRYSVNAIMDYDAMTDFDSGQGGLTHQTTIEGLDPNTLVLNDVYVRCSTQPDYLLSLKYRSLPSPNAHYPRTGNLWGWWNFYDKGVEYMSRIDLWLGADMPLSYNMQLRRLNPNVVILTSINTVEHNGLPDDYYLKDINGDKIEVWPDVYRLNLTKPEVAAYQANYAYQKILDNNLMVDGCFFDNFFVSQSWLDEDIHGNPVQLDADEDGVEDDPDWLDEQWRAGVFAEIREWRRLMPYALASGHLPAVDEPDVAEVFNSESIGFLTADVLDGKRPFIETWQYYHDWCDNGLEPDITMVESSPHDQIAYGYDYSPLEKIPASTLEFAKSYYPYVRFGLALVLMNDGYFAHEFGDTDHGQDWWYDELDFDLGHPLGPYQRVDIGATSSGNLIVNGSFENPIGDWNFWVNTDYGAEATVERVTSGVVVGTACAHVNVANSGNGTNWHVNFYQANRSLTEGQLYDFIFWARSDIERPIGVSAQKGGGDWRNYGMSRDVYIGTQWREYTETFEANETATDARLQFFCGDEAGDIWLDDVRLIEHPADVFRRDFSRGVVLLNGTDERVTLSLESGLQRLQGAQAPMHQYILDDTTDVFSYTSAWLQVEIDSGEWKSSGPFYHDWGEDCHQLDSGETGEAQWDLQLRADDTYTIQAWWPASPDAGSWSSQVVCEVVADGSIATSAMLDQTTGGDEWHTIAALPLTMSSAPYVRIRNEGTGACIADALHVFSQSRYNNGARTDEVTLEPLDGVILQRSPRAANMNWDIYQ
ncbi:carbohydrate binding domain-containing protein [Candidatus Sumerlaeota bacterium]|nr:carbohydrate binding domain-containing protein [Candidatus Sumerlaeota bacterium]